MPTLIPKSVTEAAEPAQRSPWLDARIRFMRNRAAVVSLLILSCIVLACVLGPLLLPYSYEDTDWNQMGIAPTLTGWHLFGTDELGRDLLVRTLVGGRVDALMMRIVDILYAIPYLLIAIMMVTILGRDFYLVVLTISAFSWMDMARVVRGQTLSIRSKEYVEAARAIGVPTWRIIFSHVVPNLLGIVVIYTSITVPGVILTESVLSFLGLGVQEPMTSWGVLIHDGANVMASSPWMIWFPGAALTITLYCANFIGDGMRDALDPKER